MYPVVPLIQLTLRVEREAEAQRRALDRVEHAEEKPASVLRYASRSQRHVESLCCQPETMFGKTPA